jgi:ribosomal protein S18 acetylase RimI-like enzyme
VDVIDLPRERFGQASAVMADAFVDDPGWQAVGPDNRQRLHSYVRRICGGVLRVCAQRGGPIWQVEREGRTVGVLSSLDPGQWPPPQLPALVAQASGPLLGGPAVFVRSLKGDSAMHRGHPQDPHFFVWMLAVSPAAQRSGVGRALLSKALERAEEFGVPAYLDTANPDNLPYYGSFGFQQVGETTLPRDATLWFMMRQCPTRSTSGSSA